MKSGQKKKKLALKKTSIAHLDKGNIIEIKEVLQQIKGGEDPQLTINGSTCPQGLSKACS